jgi:hypothetical protein
MVTESITLLPKCATCGVQESVTVTTEDLNAYVFDRRLVQDVWSDWSPSEREKVIGWNSGFHTCVDCFQQLGDDEDV